MRFIAIAYDRPPRTLLLYNRKYVTAALRGLLDSAEHDRSALTTAVPAIRRRGAAPSR